MDNCTITDGREENVHGSNNGSYCSLLRTAIPLPRQVSVLIELFMPYKQNYWRTLYLIVCSKNAV